MVPVSYCHMLVPGDHLWAALLPGRDAVLVTVETIDFHTWRAHRPLAPWEAESIGEDDSEAVQLGVRTVTGNLVCIDNSNILRRAS